MCSGTLNRTGKGFKAEQSAFFSVCQKQQTPHYLTTARGLNNGHKSEKLIGWFRFKFCFTVIIAFGEMVAYEFFYIFLCVEYFMVNGH